MHPKKRFVDVVEAIGATDGVRQPRADPKREAMGEVNTMLFNYPVAGSMQRRSGASSARDDFRSRNEDPRLS
jgi:hypothetical protein